MTLKELAFALHISSERFEVMVRSARIKHGKQWKVKLTRQLEKWHAELEDRPIYMEKRSGYTEIPTKAIKCRDEEGFEPEPVAADEISTYRESIQAQARYQAERDERAANLMGAVQQVKIAIAELEPNLKKQISREVFALNGRINALERKVKRRAA